MLRLYGLSETAPLNATALLSGLLSGSGRREFAAEITWDLPSVAVGATANVDVTVTGARVGDLAQASLASSIPFFELDATAWSSNIVRVPARNLSNTTIDVAAATPIATSRMRPIGCDGFHCAVWRISVMAVGMAVMMPCVHLRAKLVPAPF